MHSALSLLAAVLAGHGSAVGSPDRPPHHGWRPAGFHAVAYVTDWRSHGQLGDAFLSLNEAIQLHNGTVAFQQLSLAEAAQLSLIPGTGSTTDVTWIDIDGTSTPVITVEQDLDPILDTTFGCLIKGFNEAPVIDFSGANLLHGFRVPANSANFEDLILSGGRYGIDVTQTDAAGQVGVALDRVTFDGQSQFGLRVTGTSAGGIGRTILGRCTFVGVPAAVVHRELAADRLTIFESYDVVMRNVGNGYDSELGSGGTARYTFERQHVEATGTALRLWRGAGANRVTLVEGTHVQLGGAVAAEWTAPAGALTQLALRMWHCEGTATALSTTPAGWFGSIEDSTFAGATVLATGGPALALHNVQFRGGAVQIVGSGTGNPTLTAARFVGAPLSIAGGQQVELVEASFELGGVTLAPGAGLRLDRCHLPNPPAGAVVVASRPAPHLGGIDVQPRYMTLGGTVTLTAQLPAGLFGIFVLGFTDPFPQLLNQPLHVYTQPQLTFVLPGVYRSQQQVVWTAPVSPAFQGFDLCAQIAVLPDPSTVAAPLHFPPGRRFRLH